MRKNDLGRPLGCAALVLLPVMMATSAVAQAPNPVPPSGSGSSSKLVLVVRK